MSYQGGPSSFQFQGQQPPPPIQRPKHRGRRIAMTVVVIVLVLALLAGGALFFVVRPFAPVVVVATATPTAVPSATVLNASCPKDRSNTVIQLKEPPITHYEQPIQASGCAIINLDLPTFAKASSAKPTPVPMVFSTKAGPVPNTFYRTIIPSKTPDIATATAAAEKNGYYEIGITQQGETFRLMTITFSGIANASQAIVEVAGPRELTIQLPQPLEQQIIIVGYQ